MTEGCRPAHVRSLYDQVNFVLPFSRWEDYPVDGIPGVQREPGEFAIQNNRLRDVMAPCSGACPYCWVSDVVGQSRRARRMPTIGAETVGGYIDTLVSLGVDIHVTGEDTLDDLESFWWTLEAYERARAKYASVIPKYLQRVAQHQPEKTVEVERGLRRKPPAFGFTTCGWYFISHPEHADAFFRRLRESLASDTALVICLSWDPGKVRSYARRLRIAEDDVHDRMAATLACFANHFPTDPSIDVNLSKYKISLFLHDFGHAGSYRESAMAFLRSIRTRAAGRMGLLGVPALNLGTRVDTFTYFTARSVRWGLREGRLQASDFWPVREVFGCRSPAAVMQSIRYRPCLDFVTETLCVDYNFQELLRIRVTPDTLERALVVTPFNNPVFRKGGYIRDVVRYALAVAPDLADEVAVSLHEILSCISADEVLMLKVDLLALLDSVVTAASPGERPASMPMELLNYLFADDMLEAYLRYCTWPERQRARVIALHGDAFERHTGGVKNLAGVIADNQQSDRALFLAYLTGSVLSELASGGTFGTNDAGAASVRGQSLGAARTPRMPRPGDAKVPGGHA